VWIRRLSVLSRSLQACAGLALLLVAAVAAAVIAVATRAGLVARREAIEIVHGLGATDSYIAARFAGRATLLAATGGIAGAVIALPVLPDR
jgi:cell division transport system permease protein